MSTNLPVARRVDSAEILPDLPIDEAVEVQSTGAVTINSDEGNIVSKQPGRRKTGIINCIIVTIFLFFVIFVAGFALGIFTKPGCNLTIFETQGEFCGCLANDDLVRTALARRVRNPNSFVNDKLEIRGESFECLPPNAFDDLSFEELDFISNSIISLEFISTEIRLVSPQAFMSEKSLAFSNVQFLKFSNEEFVELPAGLVDKDVNFPSLQQLEVTNCPNFKSFQEGFFSNRFRNSNYQLISLEGSEALEVIPIAFSDLESVQVLDLSQTENLSGFPSGVFAFVQMELLNLTGSGLLKLFNDIETLKLILGLSDETTIFF